MPTEVVAHPRQGKHDLIGKPTAQLLGQAIDEAFGKQGVDQRFGGHVVLSVKRCLHRALERLARVMDCSPRIPVREVVLTGEHLLGGSVEADGVEGILAAGDNLLMDKHGVEKDELAVQQPPARVLLAQQPVQVRRERRTPVVSEVETEQLDGIQHADVRAIRDPCFEAHRRAVNVESALPADVEQRIVDLLEEVRLL
jgi:hypothetical protein